MDLFLPHRQSVVQWLIAAIGIILGMILTVYILSSDFNVLAGATIFIAVGLFLVCVVAPRPGIYLLILVSGYLDLIKRMLLLVGTISYSDIGLVLGVAPLMTAGLVIAVITRQAFHRLNLSRLDVVLFLIGSLFMGASFALAVRDTGVGLDAVKSAVNGSCYVFLVPVINRMVNGPDDLKRLFKFATFTYLPIALYGIWQQIFGLADFEIGYLRSGFTLTSELLYDFKPRPFSTLNSPTALSAITATMAILSILPILVRDRPWRSVGPLALAILYIIACICSLSRAGNLIWFTALGGFWAFGSRLRFRILSLAAVTGFILIVIFARYVQDHLAEWDPSQYTTSVFASQFSRIQTYSDRLEGFANLTESTAMYSAFGLPKEEIDTPLTRNHDGLSYLLVHFGVIPLSLLLVGAFLAFRAAYRRIFGMTSLERKSLLTAMLSLILGTLSAVVLAGGSYVTVFPNNLWFWLLVGGTVLILKDAFPPQQPSSDPSMPQHSWEFASLSNGRPPASQGRSRSPVRH